MTKSELIQYLWKLDAAQLERIIGSARYSVIDQAVNKAVLMASNMSEEELAGIRTEDEIAVFIRTAAGK